MVRPNAHADKNLFLLHCSPASELEFRAQLLAKRRSHADIIFTLVQTCVPLRLNRFLSEQKHSLMESSSSENASNSVAVNNMLNSVGASIHSCLTPFVTGKASYNWPSSRTCASIQSWSEHIRAMNLGEQSNLGMIFQRPLPQTVSKALASQQKRNRYPDSVLGIFLGACAANTMSTVP